MKIRKLYRLIIMKYYITETDIPARFEMNRRGNLVMYIGNYRYNRRSDSKGPKTNWVCVKKDYSCRATVTTIDGTVVRINFNHNH